MYNKKVPLSLNLASRTVTFSSRYGALDLEGQTTEEMWEDQSERVGPPETTPPAPCIKTSCVSGKRRAVVIGDSLLRGMEGPMCRPDPAHREVCCLPGARIRELLENNPVS